MFLCFLSEDVGTSHRVLTNKAWNCPWFTNFEDLDVYLSLISCFYLTQFQIILSKFDWLVLEPNFENPIVREFLKLSQVFAVRSNYICKFWHSVTLPSVLSLTVQHASKKHLLLFLFSSLSWYWADSLGYSTSRHWIDW